MKTLYLSLIFCLFVVSGAFSQDLPAAVPEPVDGPKIEFEAMEIDYGTIEKGSEPLRKLSFKNVGNAPLVIKGAKSSCGCTVPNYSKTPLAPGETGELEIRYDTRRQGKINKVVRITTNEAIDKPHVIRVIGNITVPIVEESIPTEKSMF